MKNGVKKALALALAAVLAAAVVPANGGSLRPPV